MGRKTDLGWTCIKQKAFDKTCFGRDSERTPKTKQKIKNKIFDDFINRENYNTLKI